MAFCSNCGAKIDDGVAFCTNCGTKVVNLEESKATASQETVTAQPQPQQNYQEDSAAADSDNDELLMRAFITGSVNPHSFEHNYDHYRKALFKMDNGGSKLSWNWSAFWVSGWNICYRKSYGLGIVINIVLWILGAVSSGVCLLLNFIPALMADSFVYSRYRENLAYAKRTFPNDITKQTEYMAENGGVNNVVPVIAVIACIIYAVFVIGIIYNSLYELGLI